MHRHHDLGQFAAADATVTVHVVQFEGPSEAFVHRAAEERRQGDQQILGKKRLKNVLFGGIVKSISFSLLPERKPVWHLYQFLLDTYSPKLLDRLLLNFVCMYMAKRQPKFGQSSPPTI